MSKIKNWTTRFTRNLDHPEVEQQIESSGIGVIALFEHEPTEAEVAYMYEPEADDPYVLLSLKHGINFEQEGRYSTRQKGYEANSELRHENPSVEYTAYVQSVEINQDPTEK